jgi:ribosomal protein L25 (general stress protein Ctc)
MSKRKDLSKGTDIMIVVKGDEQIPVEVLLKKKQTEAELKTMHGNDAIVYLGNKNLQSLPRRLKGAIIWLKSNSIVAAVVEASDSKAYVKILHPKKDYGKTMLVENLRQEGCFLQVIYGDCPMSVDYEFRRRQYHASTGELITLVDSNGCIKMNVFGPDIATFDEACKVPAEDRVQLRTNTLAVLNTEKLAKRSYMELQAMPVVYVFRKVPSNYCFVQRYWHKGTMISQWMPVFMVPIGEPYTDQSCQSNRCVFLLFMHDNQHI